MTRAELEQTTGYGTGIRAPLTSLVGRAAETAQLTKLLDEYPLVTVTGPGGVGKTRLATDVARSLSAGFPDGVWLIELASVTDAARVPAKVMAVFGVQQARDRPPLQELAEVLAPRRLLLVLDNCEHLLTAVAELCQFLLKATDEVRILATSREQLGIAGETRYRLAPLGLPASDAPEEVARSAAGALFTERARQADPRFALTADSAPLVTRVVTRLDGVPLAIELAAARIEALGMAGLAGHIDDALRLLAGTDRLAADRHRSLAAVADWSYQLLTEPAQRVLRRLGAFPGPFTLEAAEAVAGPEAGPIVLRLVDCSLLAPPRPGPDQRMRYTMLQTLRAFALARLADAVEVEETMGALTGFAVSVAAQASAGLDTTSRELDAVQLLDAEDATLSHALSWALERDPEAALRLAAGLSPWWRLRGRLAEAFSRLSAAAAGVPPAGRAWATAQVWLGYLCTSSGDPVASLGHYAAVIDVADREDLPRELVDALVGAAINRIHLDDPARAAQDARRALAIARERGYQGGELQALAALGLSSYHVGDAAEARNWARQARESAVEVPGYMVRWIWTIVAHLLAETGDHDSARQVCVAGLDLSRAVADLADLVNLLWVKAQLERCAGNMADAAADLGVAVSTACRTGDHVTLLNSIEEYGYLCAAAERWAEVATLWAALTTECKRLGISAESVFDDQRAEFRRRIEQALDPAQIRTAEERGANMTIAALVELVIMHVAEAQSESRPPAPGKLLSPREQELITLVAQGRTNAEIAASLYISVRTVASHLDRIRDKTGYRRRADLTRLALSESLVLAMA